ncbi:MAG: thiamine pyrophosphate-dependent enzyme, partial [Pseudomonadota bacterium]|nr:thiamine pyrophosphate-dependent enzyme [Pseudomonadota bacterium]
RDKHFFGGHGIVGAHVSIATGLAFTHAYREDGGVCVCYFGDGAANQGQVAESFNMAAIWKLPILFVVENNGYAMGTSQARASSGDICKRGEPYGIGGRQVDGMDVVAVREAAVKAVRDIRSGKGAQILEMMTYRYKGHSMSDPATYRTREEVDKAKDERDPIDRLNAQLLDAGIDKDDLEAIDTKIKETIKIVVAFAEKSPEPDEKELWTDVLAKD